MKVNGQTLRGPRIVEVYLPTNDGEVCFKFRALSASEDFSKVLTEPKAPKIMKPGNQIHHNVDDPNYRAALEKYTEHKLNWQFLKSISQTDDLEWATVKMDDPETWGNWRDELREHFSDAVCEKLFSSFVEAQYITEDMMEKARARFLIGSLERLVNSSFQKGDPVSTPSGKPASE